MTFASTACAISALQVGKAVLSFTRSNGEGRSYVYLCSSNPPSDGDAAKLPTISRIEVPIVDELTEADAGAGAVSDSSGYSGTSPDGPVSGNVDSYTTSGAIATPSGPVRVYWTVPNDGYNASTYCTELLDANAVVQVATG